MKIAGKTCRYGTKHFFLSYELGGILAVQYTEVQYKRGILKFKYSLRGM
jgi:hypothetical protein